MTIEEHVINSPEWIDTLVNKVLDAMTPLGFIGPLGYRWWEPDNLNNGYDGWQIVTFPTPNEAIGGKHDGCKYVSGFYLDIRQVLDVFTSVKAVAWSNPTQYNGDLDGPEFYIQGQYEGKDVWLRVFNVPPQDEPCSYAVNLETGDATEKV